MTPNLNQADHRRVYDLIWSQMPHLQNGSSSTWWFFLLMPKGPEGYGPKQLMVTLATAAGRAVRIAGLPLAGVDPDRVLQNGQDDFDAFSVAWYCNGPGQHHRMLKQVAPCTLSQEGYIRSWLDLPDGERFGGEMRVSTERPLSVDAHFRGPGGEARFTAWGDLTKVNTSPVEAVNLVTPLGGTHFIAWRLVNFAGEFTTPAGTEYLEGVGYFQRVCMNVATFPWKWLYAVFADGTLFSAYVPFAGLHAFRRDYSFFRSPVLERATLPILPGAFIDWADGSEALRFETARVRPVMDAGSYPHFDVEAASATGDFLRFRAESYGHTNLSLDRPRLRGLWRSHWNYNEYMFRMTGVEGRVQGREISTRTVGQGFGNIEYCWGLGF